MPTEETHDEKGKPKHDPFRLLALARSGNASVAIDLRHHGCQKQAEKQQGVQRRADLTRRTKDEVPHQIPHSEQRHPARPSGHEASGREQVKEEVKEHLGEKIEAVVHHGPAKRERCQTFCKYGGNGPTKGHEHKRTEEGYRLIRPPPEDEYAWQIQTSAKRLFTTI